MRTNLGNKTVLILFLTFFAGTALAEKIAELDTASLCEQARQIMQVEEWVHCQRYSNFIPASQTLLAVSQDEEHGISLASFKVADNGQLEVLEIDRSLGLEMMALKHKGESKSVVVADINGDGTLEWVLATKIPPTTGVLYIKSYDRKLKKIVKLAPHVAGAEEGFSNFVFDGEGEVKINVSAIELPGEKSLESYTWLEGKYHLVNSGLTNHR